MGGSRVTVQWDDAVDQGSSTPQAMTHYRSIACSKLGCRRDGQAHVHEAPLTLARANGALCMSASTLHTCEWSFMFDCKYLPLTLLKLSHRHKYPLLVHERKHPLLTCKATFARAQGLHKWSCTRTCTCHWHAPVLGQASNLERLGAAAVDFNLDHTPCILLPKSHSIIYRSKLNSYCRWFEIIWNNNLPLIFWSLT